MNLYTLIAAALVLGAFYGLYEGVRKPLAIQRGAVMLLVMFLMLAAGVLWGLSGTIPAVASAHANPSAATQATGHAGSASANPATPASVSGESAFVAFALPYARQAHAALGWPVSVILAQWGDEHGWQLPDFDGWNFGNERAIVGQPETANGFAYAATPAIGLAQYETVARLGYYTAIAPAAASGGADAAAVALGQSPWDQAHYEGATGQPGGTLLAIMRDFNLSQFDH